jgi:hypothetical protein
MPTKELFGLMVSGGAFNGKSLPESRFKTSIHTNVKKISQVDASGREMSAEEIKDLRSPFSAIFSGITRLKKIAGDAGGI